MLRASFNGIYRENSRGECNTPWGEPSATKDLVCAHDLRAIAALLAHADIRLGDFEATTRDLTRRDTLFADAPYVGTFTGYSKGGWTAHDRARLAAYLRDLDRRSIRWTATDSAEHGALVGLGLFHVLYAQVRRSGSCKAQGRGAAREVIVTNWQPRKEAA
jgi:DNA adenine methylase